MPTKKKNNRKNLESTQSYQAIIPKKDHVGKNKNPLHTETHRDPGRRRVTQAATTGRKKK